MFFDVTFGALAEPVSGRRWERAVVADEVGRRAARYQALGVGRGDRVLLLFGNRLEFFADLLASWCLGACAVPVDPRLTRFELDAVVAAATPRLILVDGTAPGGPSGATCPVIDSTAATADGRPSTPRPVGLHVDDPALILFTSGSTGRPKGVVHTHRSLRARWLSLHERLAGPALRRTLCLLPTHFGHGLICNSLFPWLSGHDLFVVPPFHPELAGGLGRLVDECGITFMSSVPALWRLVLKLAPPPRQGTLARIHCGSAPLSAGLWRAVQAWGGTSQVLNVYGITETGSWTAGTSGPGIVPEDGLVGDAWGALIRVLPERTVEGPEAPGLECRRGDVGHVWIATPALMSGYFGRDDLTAEVVRHGWLWTGDLGLVDDRGYLYLKGRERDEINKGGAKVFPADVDHVAEMLDPTLDACTFAIEDPLYGQNVAIAVAAAADDDARIGALAAGLRERVAGHKLPARWYRLPELPRTPLGKINRAVVGERCKTLAPLDLARLTHTPCASA